MELKKIGNQHKERHRQVKRFCEAIGMKQEVFAKEVGEVVKW